MSSLSRMMLSLIWCYYIILEVFPFTVAFMLHGPFQRRGDVISVWAVQSDASSDEIGSSNSSSLRRSRQKFKEEGTLYDVLGASFKDSQDVLKRRYTTLVKTLHPDVNPNKNAVAVIRGRSYTLSEINAAWEILGDKKQRLRYDRALQAKEFTEGVEALVGRGIQTAIPWLKKTADTTVAAVDASARAAQEGAEQAKFAYGIFELEQQSRNLEKLALTKAKSADRLQKEMESLPNKRIASLYQDSTTIRNAYNSEPKLTSMEAMRILKNFQVDQYASVGGLSTDLSSLRETEQEYQTSVKARQSMEAAVQVASRKLSQAQLAEIQAQKRLEEAQRALLDAQQKHATAQTLQAQAVTEEAAAQKDLQKVEQILYKVQQKVRAGLLQQQELYIDRRSKELKQEKAELEISAKRLLGEAKALQDQVAKLEKSQGEQFH